MLLLCLSLGVSVSLMACGGSRVVIVEPSKTLVRLGPDVRGHVYYWNGSSWELSQNTVNLPEGWYAGSVPGLEEDANPQPVATDN
jgi:hypothetical protein